jgi:hypothetical protein
MRGLWLFNFTAIIFLIVFLIIGYFAWHKYDEYEKQQMREAFRARQEQVARHKEEAERAEALAAEREEHVEKVRREAEERKNQLEKNRQDQQAKLARERQDKLDREAENQAKAEAENQARILAQQKADEERRLSNQTKDAYRDRKALVETIARMFNEYDLTLRVVKDLSEELASAENRVRGFAQRIDGANRKIAEQNKVVQDLITTHGRVVAASGSSTLRYDHSQEIATANLKRNSAAKEATDSVSSQHNAIADRDDILQRLDSAQRTVAYLAPQIRKIEGMGLDRKTIAAQVKSLEIDLTQSPRDVANLILQDTARIRKRSQSDANLEMSADEIRRADALIHAIGEQFPLPNVPAVQDKLKVESVSRLSLIKVILFNMRDGKEIKAIKIIVEADDAYVIKDENGDTQTIQKVDVIGVIKP